MTEKHTEKVSDSDPTRVDAPPPSEPDLLAFAPNKFSRIEFSPELRKQISGSKLPGLDPAVLQDTIPPDNQALTSARVAAPEAAATSQVAAEPRVSKPSAAVTQVAVPSPNKPLAALPVVSLIPRDDGRPFNINDCHEYKIEGYAPELNATQTYATPEEVIARGASAADLAEDELAVATVVERAARRRRQRNVVAGVAIAMLFLTGLGVFALLGRDKEPTPSSVAGENEQPTVPAAPAAPIAAVETPVDPAHVVAPEPSQPMAMARPTENAGRTTPSRHPPAFPQPRKAAFPVTAGPATATAAAVESAPVSTNAPAPPAPAAPTNNSPTIPLWHKPL